MQTVLNIVDPSKQYIVSVTSNSTMVNNASIAKVGNRFTLKETVECLDELIQTLAGAFLFHAW